MKIQDQIEINGKWYPCLREETDEERNAREEQERQHEQEQEEQWKNMPYQDKVEKLVLTKYSLQQEIAINRQRETKPEEFDEYFTFVELCKTLAKSDKTKKEIDALIS